MDLENENPNIFEKRSERIVLDTEEDEDFVDEIDAREIFDLIKTIKDPEHPLTLEELNVIQENLIHVDNTNNDIKVLFTPTIPHCSMASLIGLSIRIKLIRCLPSRFKVSVEINPGTHVSEQSVNKQLGDKERVAAAQYNEKLMKIINQCIVSR